MPPLTFPAYHPGALVVVLAGLTLGACSSPAAREADAAPSVTPVYFYPARGQAPEQQDRDRYECYLWARKQTGFDPSDPRLAPHQRYAVVPTAPPGQTTAAGAVTGAVIGSVVAQPGHTAEGAAAGAVAGAVIGATAEAAQQQQAARATKYRMDAQLEQQAANYRRALTACLEGRGYSVR